MRRQSVKVRQAEPDFKKVYALVNLRSEGRCECVIAGSRCARRGVEHHHLVKPRRSRHQPELVVHVCRDHHDQMARPYARGRLVWLGVQDVAGLHYYFGVRYASDKFAARQPKAG